MYRVGFDLFQPKVDESAFNSGEMDWMQFYGGIKEQLPPGIPEQLGQGQGQGHTECFFYANQAGNVVTQRLNTDVLIYVTNAPIIWFSKKQDNVEISTFRFEFVAICIRRDLIVALS